MKEAFRQIAIVGISCVITIVVWLAVRLQLNQAHIETSKVVDLIIIMLIYVAIRMGIKTFLMPKRK